MPSLKDLKNRIASVQSTRKITSAMKMVAASKLRRAQEQAEASRPYAERMDRMLESLASDILEKGANEDGLPKLVTGSGSDKVQLLLVVTSDRGLCGGFNSTIVREVRRAIQRNDAEGKTTKLICVGRKGRDQLRRDYGNLIVHYFEEIGKPRLTFADAKTVSNKVIELFDAGDFDVAHVVYNKFKSVIAQIVTLQQLVPLAPPKPRDDIIGHDPLKPSIEFEPEEQVILAELLPRNLAFQIFRALLESAASEQGARMAAMDNATRNAGEMIQKLTLNYNRTRQAVITKELIEIISGAEAL
ncbi:MAG: F0F1 ATP synthase subunit gamma [Rhodospirillaceae bacterium]